MELDVMWPAFYTGQRVGSQKAEASREQSRISGEFSRTITLSQKLVSNAANSICRLQLVITL